MLSKQPNYFTTDSVQSTADPSSRAERRGRSRKKTKTKTKTKKGTTKKSTTLACWLACAVRPRPAILLFLLLPLSSGVEQLPSLPGGCITSSSSSSCSASAAHHQSQQLLGLQRLNLHLSSFFSSSSSFFSFSFLSLATHVLSLPFLSHRVMESPLLRCLLACLLVPSARKLSSLHCHFFLFAAASSSGPASPPPSPPPSPPRAPPRASSWGHCASTRSWRDNEAPMS